MDKPTVKTLKNMIATIEKDCKGKPINIDDMEITFEYINASLFPDLIKDMYKKIENQINEAYNKGFQAGLSINVK